MGAPMRSLWPPLEVIKASLVGVTQAERDKQASPPAPVPDGDTSMQQDAAAMPAFMKDLIARRVATQTAALPVAPMPGQIRACDEIRNAAGVATKHLRKPITMLLDQQIDGNTWAGWLVTSETDYATYWDMLLDDRDQPFDPLAGMIQIWNPTRCVVPTDSRAFGQLSNERLEMARQMALDFKANAKIEDKPRPGFVAMRSTSTGMTVLTGTPLGSSNDPRRAYQQLYQALAREMSDAIAPSNVAVLAPRKQSAWLKPAFAIAATILVVQGIVIQQLLGPRTPVGIETGDLTRGVPVQQDKVVIEVFFKPTSQEMEIRKLLTQVRGKIVSGPGEYGDYQVAVPKADVESAMQAMSASGIVDSVGVLKESVPGKQN